MKYFWFLVFFQSFTTFAADKLILISPHRKSIQNEMIPAFKSYYKASFKTEVEVEWLDQGGTNEALKFVKTKYTSNPKSCGIDLFWGGGTTPFLELKKSQFLEKFELSKKLATELPADIGGIPMRDSSQTWFASAVSSFGIFYNKKLLKLDKIDEPKTWTDLTSPKFYKKISLTDPRKSGTANQINQIILQSLGWEEGFKTLTTIAANANEFTASSSDPIKAIVSGSATVTTAIDFYAMAKVNELGPDNLGFILPDKRTILDPDPIAILKGSPNKKAAERFVEWVMSVDAQKLFVLPKGAEGGPKLESLGRMSVNKETYNHLPTGVSTLPNPFNLQSPFKMDIEKAAKVRQVFDDLLGAMLVDTHKDLKKAWEKVAKSNKKDSNLLTEIAKTPISEKDMEALSEKWSDAAFRGRKINEWVAFSQKKYAALAK